MNGSNKLTQFINYSGNGTNPNIFSTDFRGTGDSDDITFD